MIPRPPLPPGPYLVVGLARSGVAAALALRERGARGDRRRLGPGAARRRPSACAPPASPSTRRRRRPGAARGRRQRDQEPRRAAGGAGDRGRPRARDPRARRVRDRVAAARRARVHRRHRLQRQDDHRRADRPPAPRGGPARERGGQRRHGARPRCRARSRPATTVVAEASSFQLEDTRAFAPEAAVLLNLAEDHLDRHGTFEAYRAAKLEIFARQPNEAVAVAPLGLGVEDLGGCARRVCFGAGPGAELADRAGQLWWDEEPLLAVSELGLRGAHNVQNAMAAAAVGARARGRRRRRPRRPALLPRPRAPARGGRDRRRRALRQRLQGDQRRLGARRHRLVPRRRPRHPRRAQQGRRLHRARRPRWPSAAAPRT